MLSVKLICVGKMKEKHYISAFEEYRKRLGAYCKFELLELSEQRLPENPSEKEIYAALEKEATEIEKQIPSGAALCAMCIEGDMKSSPELASVFEKWTNSGKSKFCFVIGGSRGLSERIKSHADLRLSMSRMTFPHHLARVMVGEQIYRAFTIIEGSKYHK
ncbi:MAG: 23S rRNA (pseudouridine(1915)-N(3))-methyltransferase RlmH [Oscillospiraceae bacterium]|nr:23S rRNA (pseudouridine(1915)-N(3))-methyltransferase RlmH [Oscillospiraceae bacterium]